MCIRDRLYGQSQQLSVSDITFTGAQKNDVKFLYSLLKTQLHQELDAQHAEEDRQTLANLAGIQNVSYQSDTVKHGLHLNFSIEERKTLLPIINFGGIEGNIWYRIGFTDTNWKGKGQTLLAYYQNNDRRHSGQVYFKNPTIHNSTWGYSLGLNSWASVEPVFFANQTLDYLYDNDAFSASIIKRLNLRSQFELGGTFFREQYRSLNNPSELPNNIPSELTQHKWLIKSHYYLNKIDYHFFYASGYTFDVSVQQVFNNTDENIFHSVLLESKYFKRIQEKSNLAARVRLGISTNNDSPFAPFVADSHVNIRGVGNRIDRGTAQVVFNLEWRYTLTHKKNWSTQLVAFSDLGTWRNPGGSLSDLVDSEQFRHFIGAGFRLNNLKLFHGTLRVDYGIDIYNKKQRGLVIGFGQYF